MNRILKYSALLIGGYIAVAYASGSGRVIEAATGGASNVIKTLQARR